MTEDERAEPERAVVSFLQPDSPARRLHSVLEADNARQGTHSWLDTFWAGSYLGRRDRHRPQRQLLLPVQRRSRAKRSGPRPHRRRRRLQGSPDAERIEPVVQRGQALSMEQNKYLFSPPGSRDRCGIGPECPTATGPTALRHGRRKPRSTQRRVVCAYKAPALANGATRACLPRLSRAPLDGVRAAT
ncbi:MAG: choline/carnitine O-acyltransferase [Acidimicrobiales bacterium]